jgi:hypothetical protein
MYVPIGGIDRWIQFGEDQPNHPVLLYLHYWSQSQLSTNQIARPRTPAPDACSKRERFRAVPLR